MKTLTWRAVATTDTVLIGWLITGKLGFGLKIGALEVVTKMLLYYGHERLWYKSKFGLEEGDPHNLPGQQNGRKSPFEPVTQP